jgi:alcohol dehydrogenase
MMALVYESQSRKSWTDVPDVKLLRATDAIVRVTRTTICGSDLNIIKGAAPGVAVRRILGHQGVGVVEEVASGVSRGSSRGCSLCTALGSTRCSSRMHSSV